MKIRNITFSILLLFISSCVSLFGQQKYNQAVDFTISSIDGVEVNLFDEIENGKTIILDFYSTSCISCALETPIVDSIYRQFGSGTGDLLAWGIVHDASSVADIEQFIEDNGLTFPSFQTAHATDVFSLYGIQYTPQIIIVCNYQASNTIPNNTIIESLDHCFPTRITTVEVFPSIYNIENGISVLNDNNEDVTVSIYSITGQKITSRHLTSKENFDFANLKNNSIYIVDIITSTGSRYSKKIFVK